MPTSHLESVGNRLYFSADDGIHGDELWRSDGTATGTVMVKDITSGEDGSDPEGLTAVGNTLYFHAFGARGQELWKSDGTAAGTTIVENDTKGRAARTSSR